jgi:hypothetical protein
MALRDILAALRRWLGYVAPRFFETPLPVVRLAARVADRFGGIGPITTTSLTMLLAGNAADPAPFMVATGITPRRFSDALASEPAHVQDRWHARLYFLRPLLRFALGFFWLCTGFATLALWPHADSLRMLGDSGIPGPLRPIAFHVGWAFDVALGLAMLLRYRIALVGGTMIAATAVYLVFLSIGRPWEWIDPITPLTICIPLMAATLVVIATDDDR